MPNLWICPRVGTTPLRSARGHLAGTLLKGEKGQFFLRPTRSERAANRLRPVFTWQPFDKAYHCACRLATDIHPLAFPPSPSPSGRDTPTIQGWPSSHAASTFRACFN